MLLVLASGGKHCLGLLKAAMENLSLDLDTRQCWEGAAHFLAVTVTIQGSAAKHPNYCSTTKTT